MYLFTKKVIDVFYSSQIKARNTKFKFFQKFMQKKWMIISNKGMLINTRIFGIAVLFFAILIIWISLGNI